MLDNNQLVLVLNIGLIILSGEGSPIYNTSRIDKTSNTKNKHKNVYFLILYNMVDEVGNASQLPKLKLIFLSM